MAKRLARGRPTENSRGKVLEVARMLLSKNPDSPLTMAKVAKEMGLVTMALYKHVKSKHDLMEGVAELVFADFHIEPANIENWEQQLENWSVDLRVFFHNNPYIVKLIGWELHMSSAWLSLTASLTNILKLQGLSEEALAINVQWYSRTLIAYLMLELVEGLDVGSQTWIKNSESGLDQLNDDDRANLEVITPILKKRSSEDEFTYFLKRTIASLRLVLVE